MFPVNKCASGRGSLAFFAAIAFWGGTSVMPVGAQTPGRVPALSIGDIIDTGINAHDAARVAQRGQFISELVQGYECQVLTRSYGQEVLTEKTIDEVAYIDGLRVPTNDIQTADYVVSGHFSMGVNRPITGHVYCTDIRIDPIPPAQWTTFGAKTTFEIPAQMARAVGHLLSLTPRPKADAAGASLPKESVWVIHPLLRCSPGWGEGSFMDASLALQIEAELQKQGIVKRLVDRQTLDAVLKEHHQATLSEHGQPSARMLAQLIKADILLTGQVAQEEKNFRIDLFLVDSRSGSLLSAGTAKDIPEDQLVNECVRLVTRLAETPLVIPPLTPSPSAGRKREATVLIAREHDPDYPGGIYDFNRARSEMESLINAAEGAYLLVHEEPAFVYQNIQTLWQGYKRWAFFNAARVGDSVQRYPFKYLVSMQRTACLINQALQPFEHSPATPTPRLYRADALMYAGRYPEAIALAESHLERHPQVQAGWALEILAKSHYELGHKDKAVDCARRSIALQPISWFTHDILSDTLNEKVRENLKTTGEDDRAAYETYRRLFYTEGTKISAGEWKHYLELMRKIDGPKKALEIESLTAKGNVEYVEKQLAGDLIGSKRPSESRMMQWTLRSEFDAADVLFITHFHVAACLAGVGQKEKAVRNCKDIMAYADSVEWAWKLHPLVQSVRNEAAALCEQLEKEIGPVAETWKPGREVRRFENHYHLYLVPLTDYKKEYLNELMKHLVAFYGDDAIGILPTCSAPKSTIRAGEYNYQCRPFFEGTLKRMVVPDDALHLVFLTDAPTDHAGLLCAGQMDNFNDPKILSPVLISAFALRVGNLTAEMAIRDLAWKIISSFNYVYADRPPEAPRENAQFYNQYGVAKKVCPQWTCIFHTALWYSTASQGLRLSMCPACQADYRKADFDRIHTDLIDYLSKAGAQIVPLREYREKINFWGQSYKAILSAETNETLGRQMAQPDLDDSAWPEMEVGIPWEKTALPSFDGLVWMRKTVEIPAAWAGKDLILHLGPVDEIDATWFNAVRIGGMGSCRDDVVKYWDAPRVYPVPGSAVKAGRAVLTVRIIDTVYAGGICGANPQDMILAPADGSDPQGISVSGKWKYQVGQKL